MKILLALITAFGLMMAETRDASAAGKIVISQVYGGGGSSVSTVTYHNDYVELFNQGDAAVVMTGWSLQYGAAGGNFGASGNLFAFPAGTTIQPGHYLLIMLGTAGTGGANFPVPADLTTNALSMSAASGKVALANIATALPGGATATPIPLPDSRIVDEVSYGAANNAEGGTAVNNGVAFPNNTQGAVRKSSGCQDTDNNNADFDVVANPVPRNSASPVHLCSGGATQVVVETKADGSGVVVPSQALSSGNTLTVYAISRDSGGVFVANVAGTWSLTAKTGGVADTDLVASGDGKSATFTANNAGSAAIHVISGSLTSVDSGTITVNGVTTSPSGVGAATPPAVPVGANTVLTVSMTPGANPTSTGLTVTADLSALGGSASQSFYDDGTHGDAVAGDHIFSVSVGVPANTTPGPQTITANISDAQGRSGTATISVQVLGNLLIVHANDTHARVTPHEWVIPQHSTNPATQFEESGGAAYLGGKIVQLVTGRPDALVLDGGDISEGNPVGDWNGPGSPIGTFGNGTIVEYFKLLDTKLRAVPGRGGRGLDAMVVGNHDIRDISYLNNMRDQTNFPVISINICSNGTHSPYFKPYVILNINGNRIGVVGYTTETSDSPESVVNNTINVVHCDWSSTDTNKIHFADYVNDLRNNQGCNLVILLTHDGHSDLCTSSSGSTPILVDSPVAKLPEVAITGHWHTYADSVWQPSVLNYKTIFTEEGSFMHYVGELQITGQGRYLSNTNYPIRDSDITPDPDIANLVQTRKDEYNATGPAYTLDQVVGYTADDLLLDNKMKWWSSDEFPWSGNNTAGNWICDGVEWKATQLFGQCDLSMESGGGVRSDIPAGPVTYTQIYETYPWADDIIYRVNMTGQEIWNYIQQHGCDVGISRGWFIKAFDGAPTSITYNGLPIDLTHVYTVGINNYMYIHDSVPFSDPAPLTSTNLARSALVEFTAQYPQTSPYDAGDSRYDLNTEFSGGYRAVVTMMNDADSRTAFDDGFIRFLSANNETLGHRGTRQVPVSLVNADGSFIQSNRLAEIELYRSYLGFRTNVLKPGDIIETWGKGSFFGGDPEFVDQEGIYADGVEFKIVGHDDSLALPGWVPDIKTALDDWHKNHYMQFLARRIGASTVVDQQGTTLTVMDVTGFATKSLPGANGNLLLLTGVPTSESFAMRFRCAIAVLASSAGFTNFPPVSSVDTVSPYEQTQAVLHLTAHAELESQSQTSLTPVADAEVEHGTPNANLGTSTSMFIASASTGSFGDERAWARFDLSTLSLPPGAVVTNVQLKLFCWSASSIASLPVEMHGVATDTWGETNITWNNQPALGPVLDTETLALGVENLWYSWNVTEFATNELAGDKLASFAAKAVTEGAPSSISYGFDAREFSGGANAPILEFDYDPHVAAGSGVAQVVFQYRYSADSSTWTSWTSFNTNTTAPYAADFNYPNSYGFYEFRSIATGTDGTVEPAPLLADSAVHFVNHPPVAADYEMSCWRNLSNTLATAKLVRAGSDPEGDAISVVAVSNPTANSGTVTLNGGTITYFPALNFAGADTFTYTLQDAHGATAQGTVTVHVNVPAGSGPSVLRVTSSGGVATIYFAGIPDQSYIIEASSDLVNWQQVGTETAGANGLYQYVDPDAGSFTQRYYRSRVP